MIKKTTNSTRWIDKTNNYPTALTKQTYRTNWIVALSFIASLMLNVLIVPLFFVASFFVGKLIINYRRFKTDRTATIHLPVKSLKRLIPVYSIGFMSLAFSAFLLCACSLLFHPLGEAAAVLMIFGGAWGILGLLIGELFYPDIFNKNKTARKSMWDQSLNDFSNLNGTTNPASPNYSGRHNRSMFRS